MEQPLPGFTERLTSLSGAYYWEWLLGSLAIIAVALVFRRTLWRWLQHAPLSIAALVFLALVLTLLNLRSMPTGDEPHYLIMTQSVLRDADFDLRNNYENMDYLEYYPDVIPDPHVTIVGDQWYPVHGIGVPLLAAPWFAFGGRTGVTVMLALMTAAAVRALWSLLRRAGFSLRSTGIATAVAGFTLPFSSLSGQVFPEVPAFLLVTLALHSILAPALTRWNQAALLLSLGLLPWLHPKYQALAAALLLSVALTHRERLAVRRLALAGAVFVMSVTGSALLSYWWYGVPLSGAPIMMAQAPFAEDWLMPLVGHFLVEPGIGLIGVLFDQQSGLFFASPAYVLAIPGMLLLWLRRRTLAIACGAVFFSVYLPAGTFGVWYGGFSSPARLLAPLVPVLALGLAGVLDRGGRQGWQLFTVLALPSFLHAYLMAVLPSFVRYGDPSTQHNYFVALFERFTNLDLTLLFPSFRQAGQVSWLTMGAYLLAVVLISYFVVRQDVMHRAGEPS